MSNLKKIRKIILIFLLVLLVLVVGLLLLLTVTEYRPKETEPVEIQGKGTESIQTGQTISILTWNIGYGALGDDADFFMDGGKSVRSSDKNRVRENVAGISEAVLQETPDIVFFQEVDRDSKRSYYIDEGAAYRDTFLDYDSSFAYNYKVLYVPYPIPTIGKVNCGEMTFSKFDMQDAERIALPCPFRYPIRLANLKRCLLVNRIPIEDSDKELVLVNLHLEAYDSGEGKIAQTKMLKQLLEEEMEKGNYVIAGGDFNQSFSNIDISRYETSEKDSWKPGIVDVDDFSEQLHFIADDKVPSCRSLEKAYDTADKSNFQYYVIDGFIVSDNLSVKSCESKDLDFRNSDHNPQVLVVQLQ